LIKDGRIYPYEVGGSGTSIAEFLSGKLLFGVTPPPAVFHEGSAGGEHHSAQRLQRL
jgi:hypothetical protein